VVLLPLTLLFAALVQMFMRFDGKAAGKHPALTHIFQTNQTSHAPNHHGL